MEVVKKERSHKSSKREKSKENEDHDRKPDIRDISKGREQKDKTKHADKKRDKSKETSKTRESKKFTVLKKEATPVTPPVDQKPFLPHLLSAPASTVATGPRQGKLPSFKIPKVKREPMEPSPISTTDGNHFRDAPVASVDVSGISTSHDLQPAYPSPFRTTKSTASGVCKFWLDGCCPKSAEDCFFEHFGVVEKEWKKCKFYAFKDSCAKGKACSFMHETYPCRAFHLFGVSACPTPCKFSHEPLDDITRPLFEEVGMKRNSVNVVYSRFC